MTHSDDRGCSRPPCPKLETGAGAYGYPTLVRSSEGLFDPICIYHVNALTVKAPGFGDPQIMPCGATGGRPAPPSRPLRSPLAPAAGRVAGGMGGGRAVSGQRPPLVWGRTARSDTTGVAGSLLPAVGTDVA